MKLESLNSSKFETLTSNGMSKILGGNRVEDSGTGDITRDNGKTWETVPERCEYTDEGLIVCREYFYDDAWH